MNDSQAGKCNEEFFTDVVPIEPVLGEMDYTNTREVIIFLSMFVSVPKIAH